MARYKLPKVLPQEVEPIPLTPETWEAINTKYRQLVQQREEVQERVNEARAMGDLSENGAYKYGKWELGNIGRQQRDLRFLLKHGHVVKNHTTDQVGFGCQVTLEGPKGKQTFMLVTQYESDPVKGKLSMESPIGQALIGKKVGEVVTITTPAGKSEFKILDIA